MGKITGPKQFLILYDQQKEFTFVSVCEKSIGQLKTAILACVCLVTEPSVERLNTIPLTTFDVELPDPRILQTRTLSGLKLWW